MGITLSQHGLAIREDNLREEREIMKKQFRYQKCIFCGKIYLDKIGQNKDYSVCNKCVK